MTSLDIAEQTGIPHKNVLRSIRTQEEAWEKVNGRKFELVEYTDAKGEKRPCYSLTKTECLYIATKFNDEARAKLVLRWEQLELEKQKSMPQVPQTFSQALLLAAKQQEQIEQQKAQIAENEREILQLTSTVASMEQKVTYLDKILACKSTVKTTVIAQDYGMTAIAMNSLLNKLGIQYKVGKTWVLYSKYLPFGYVKDVPFEVPKKDGTSMLVPSMQWTQKGRMFLYDFLKEKGILPLIEQENN